MSEFGYIPEAPEQSFGNNKGIFTPTDIYDLTRADKYTQYGQLELIETVVADDSVAYYDFDNLGDYNVHFLTANNIQGASTTAQNLDIRVKIGGSVDAGANYQFAQQLGNSAGTFSESNSTGFNQFIWLPNVDNETNASANGYAYIYNAIDSTKYTFGTFQTVIKQDVHTPRFSFGSNVYTTANQCSGLRVFLSTTGNIAEATISLYGIKEYS
jgi:hypothetical protein